MSWYRVHNDILDNPKLLMLAPSDRWYFIAILSLKSQGVLEKFAGDKLDRVMCAKLRLTRDEWHECARRLQEEDLIDAKYQPVGWTDRQFHSDSSTDRVRKHREKNRDKTLKAKAKKASNGGETLHVTESETLQGRSSNGNGTPPDTDTDTDKPHSDLDKSRSGAVAPVPVDNSLGAVGLLYESENPVKAVFDSGVKFLAQYGHSERAARSFLGKALKDHGESATVDAMAKAMIFEPVDPTAWVREVLQRADRATPIPMDWAPPDDWVESAIQATDNGDPGIPLDLIRKARDTFVLWFTHTGIPHHDWLAMFRRWCARDWERAQFNRAAYLQRLATAGGLGEYVHFAT